MLQQCAFSGNGRMLKGALHCHTTRSDGEGSPEEVITLHAKNGYDFLALTDHRIYNYRKYTDLPITILPGMEIDRRFTGEEEPWRSHCFHSVLLGPEKEQGNGYAQDETVDAGYVSGQSEFQPLLDEAHRRGNLTMLCHPQWSALTAREFDRLEGIFAMELWNSGCAMENGIDTDNGFLWDEMLRRGKRWFGTAVDDGHPMNEHCHGWVMLHGVNTVKSILNALRTGAFYSSCGPEIKDFFVDDDGVAHVACSPVKTIRFFYGWSCPWKKSGENGAPITAAEDRVPAYASYVRADVTDENGHRAWTNPLFLDQPER